MNTQIIAIANQKGGVGKTTTCANLGIGLAQAGKKVLLIAGDPQGSLTISLGHPQPDKLPFTLSDAMGRILMDEPLRPGEGILHHPEGVDLMPADIQLSGMEVSLVNAMSRETILRQYLDTLKGQYTAPLDGSGSTMEQLERLYEQFNLQKPVDFHSPSMSVSDIVAIKQNGQVSCHYCDSVGFTQVQGFLPENSLRNAEMTVEDDYGMIDGIINNGPKEPTVAQLEQQARSGQPISLMDLAAAVHREEREKKKSVMEQLKSQPKTEHKKTAQKKSAEREL